MLLFRPPFDKNIYTLSQDSANPAIDFVSFDEKKILKFSGEIITISEDDVLKKPFFTNEIEIKISENFIEESEERYIQKLEKVIKFIKENKLQKLVISRRKLLNYSQVSADAKLNLSESFLSLCKNYPNSFSYLFYKDGECWMGAFSEILGKFNNQTSEFETMSLAGTLPTNENWTPKEIEEQKPVSEYIEKNLMNFSQKIEKSDTYDHISGNIKHLRTDFKTKIDSQNLEKIISALHPTPAVCGIPKNFCRKAIEDFEDEPREFYSGYIRLETPNNIQYFVNLRCAKFMKNAAIIYVGGGITAHSNPDKEWRETELKSEAIIRSLI